MFSVWKQCNNIIPKQKSDKIFFFVWALQRAIVLYSPPLNKCPVFLRCSIKVGMIELVCGKTLFYHLVDSSLLQQWHRNSCRYLYSRCR